MKKNEKGNGTCLVLGYVFCDKHVDTERARSLASRMCHRRKKKFKDKVKERQIKEISSSFHDVSPVENAKK